MPDREQVIKELEKQIRLTESVNSGWVHLTIEKAKKALELLKIHEPARAIREFSNGDKDGSWWYECGNCLNPIDCHDVFCSYCGKRLVWDAGQGEGNQGA